MISCLVHQLEDLAVCGLLWGIRFDFLSPNFEERIKLAFEKMMHSSAVTCEMNSLGLMKYIYICTPDNKLHEICNNGMFEAVDELLCAFKKHFPAGTSIGIL